MPNYHHTKATRTIGPLFWQVFTLWQRTVKAALRPYDLTHTQYFILCAIETLSESSADITQKEISSQSMIDPMTVSSTLRLLEKKKLVSRLPNSSDSRSNQIGMTKQGRALLSRTKEVMHKIDQEFFFDNANELQSFHFFLRRLKQTNQDQT